VTHPPLRLDWRPVPAHSVSARRPRRWSWLAAVAAVGALVVVVRPALGHGDPAGAGSPDPGIVAAASPTTSPAARPKVAVGPEPSRRPGPTPDRTAATPTAAATIPVSATGKLAVVAGRAGPSGPGRTLTYRLEIEAGLPVDGAAIAEQVHRVLTDPRGWQPIEGVAFARTDGDAAFALIIASPALTDRLCYPLLTLGELSCRNGNKVILNARRWAAAVPWYAGHLDEYRAYLVNHEVGHRLGHGHTPCRTSGAPAPVMMQQSKGIGACRPNAWPSVAAD